MKLKNGIKFLVRAPLYVLTPLVVGTLVTLAGLYAFLSFPPLFVFLDLDKTFNSAYLVPGVVIWVTWFIAYAYFMGKEMWEK